MAKYEFKVELTLRERPDDTDNATDEPTLAQLADAIQIGIESEHGDDFEVRVYDGSRPDRD